MKQHGSAMEDGSRWKRFSWRSATVFAHDLLGVAFAWVLAYFVRYNLLFNEMPWGSVGQVLAVVLPVHVVAFLTARLYGGIWRYASLPDLRRIVLAVVGATIASPMCFLMLRLDAVIPRTVLLLAPIFLLLVMGGNRLAYRMWRESGRCRQTQNQGEPVIVLGAGDAAANLLREITRSHRWRAVAVLDDDRSKHGGWMHGVRVVGAIADFPHAAASFGTHRAVLAMPSVPPDVRRSIMEYCVSHGAEMMTVPSFEEQMQGAVPRGELLRRIDVADLLGREPVKLDTTSLESFIGDKVVMVTGAGGSIGSELCRQLARFHPRLLVCVDSSEYALYRLDENLTSDFDVSRVCIVGDVKHQTRMQHLMQAYRPRVVFHAAAYKHVPLMEELNAWEAVRNNALGTYVTATAAMAAGAEKFVLVSTDKAVNPTNVMGASKRLAEMLCQSLSGQGQTKFEIVRFGNVLGSAGSVIPKFEAQIARGGPVTVTHPEIIRYFMSIPEAAQLVMQAGWMGHGGEIFILDMGQPVKIVDLARSMIRLAGASERDIRIEYTGLRPGEKLYEELLADDELTRATEHPKLRIAKSREVDPASIASILEWLRGDEVRSEFDVKRELRRWVPEYSPAMPRPALQVVNGGSV